MPSPKKILNTPNRAALLAATCRFMVIAILLCPHLVYAQKTLGEVLDAGGLLMSLEQFKQEIMFHAVIGPTPTGGTVEIMYGSNGRVAGIGNGSIGGGGDPSSFVPIGGQWYAGEKSSICATYQMRRHDAGNLSLPPRCQYWFKVGDQYFLSDSDIDRQARVLARTIKP